MSASLTDSFDVACIGAGILGLATARALQQKFRCRVVVLETEKAPAQHQTGHNSGVIHSGLYYKPGSLKATNCTAGRLRLVEYCQEKDIPFEQCGKLVIATREDEIPRLDELERRGRANGLDGLRRLTAEQIPDYEPHARGLAALHVPETGIVDYVAVASSYARDVSDLGGDVRYGWQVTGIDIKADVNIETTGGDVRAKAMINCGGLQCDRVARLAGAQPAVRIVPFRGDYFDLAEDSRHLLANLIYPVPDPRFPFLGVHLTRRLDGSVEAGPNAVLAFRREGYAAPRFDLRDTWSTVSYPGFWRMALRFWRIALHEFLRAGSPRRFARELQRFVPEIGEGDLASGGCGIRAQALAADGSLLDDFSITRAERSLHVLNAPSPAATASLAIGDSLADMAADSFELRERPA